MEPCQFCASAVEVPTGDDAFEEIHYCPGCGAAYWIELAAQLADVKADGAVALGVPQADVDEKIVRNIGQIRADPEQLLEEDAELCLVFVQAKPAVSVP